MRRTVGYSGVAAVVLLWTTIGAGTVAAGFDLLGDRPISYLGTDHGSKAFFTVGLAGASLLFLAFHREIRRRFPVAPGFSPAMVVGLAGQFVAAFVPIGGDAAAYRIHTISALVLGASLPLLMWRFAAGQPRGRWRTLGYSLLWGEVAACVTGVWLSRRSVAALAEILPAAVFHAWVLTLTFAARPLIQIDEPAAPKGPAGS